MNRPSMRAWRGRAWALGVLAACTVRGIEVHPAFELKRLLLDGFNPRVSGLDVLSDGRVALSTWEGGNFSNRPLNKKAEVYLVDGVQGPEPGNFTVTKVAGDLFDVQGLVAVNDTLFIIQRDELTRVVDENGDGKADRLDSLVGGWDLSGHYHEFSFGLLHRDGIFYAALNCNLKGSGEMLADRTSLIAMDPAKGTFGILAGGLRTPNGLAFGPEGEIFASDNQGRWLPSSKLMHLETGSYQGYKNINHPLRDRPFKPPAIWAAHGKVAKSPTQPIMVPNGIFQGQMLVGDANMAGMRRYFLEKVNGQWQGAAFRFTGDLNASGINRLAWGPDGHLYLGSIGHPGNWPKPGGVPLQKLIPKDTVIFEMLAVRSRAGGLEIEFTKPVATGAADASRYSARTWTFEPGPSYGEGNGKDEHDLTVTSAELSPDGKRVYLAIGGLEPGYLVNLVLDGVKSGEGEDLWDYETWYTLNSRSNSSPFASADIASGKAAGEPDRFHWYAANRTLYVSARGTVHLELYSPAGKRLLSRRAHGPTRVNLSEMIRERGVYGVLVKSRTAREFRKVVFH